MKLLRALFSLPMYAVAKLYGNNSVTTTRYSQIPEQADFAERENRRKIGTSLSIIPA